MRCRQIKNGEVVWFNSLGKDANNNAIKDTNFVDNQLAVSCSLIQRLSVLKNELWYKVNYGLPLFDKVKSKVFMDSNVTQIIMQHPDVVKIISFSSKIENKTYVYTAFIESKFGNLTINSSDVTV